MPAPLDEQALAELLAPYGPSLAPVQLSRFRLYLEILQRWNRRINLTGIRESQRAVRELFGESIFLGRVVKLRGRLLDVGSGGGFPGLPVKIACPELEVTLLDSDRRKCAFLKEVIRECGLKGVRVVSSRFEQWEERIKSRVDVITTKAVSVETGFLDGLAEAVEMDGMLAVFTTEVDSRRIRQSCRRWSWKEAVLTPETDSRVILVGKIL